MNEKDRKFLRMVGVMSTAVLTPVFSVLVGFLAGLFLDRRFGTSPWLTILLLLLGLIAGGREVYRFVKRSQKMLEEDDEENHDQ